MFEKAKWIVNKDSRGADTYTEYLLLLPECICENDIVELDISCDGVFAAFKNDEILPIAFSACADMPDYKLYDTFDIGDKVKKGDAIRLQVWHEGVNTANYIAAPPGVIFELRVNGKTVLCSNETTQSRVMSEYKNGYKKEITPQLGFSFLYDSIQAGGAKVYGKSILGKRPVAFYPRAIKNQFWGEFIQGKEIKKETSILFDLEKETTGFLYLNIDCKKSGKITIAYGEHILDGGVRQKVGDRDFSVEYLAKTGNNEYANCFRRLGCRYLEIFADEDVIEKINAGGIYPTGYPVTRRNLHYGDALIEKINSVCVDTLELCMHEHYEDCPWREQGMYCFDGRNQALCGYYAFEGGNAAYARANLLLIGKSIRPDGLLNICATGGTDCPIPFFSLAYFFAVEEYVLHTGDETLLDEVKSTMDTIYATFEKRVEKNGLIARFSSPYWNFYEWSDGNDNYDSDLGKDKNLPKEKEYHCALNCAFVLAKKAYCKLFGIAEDGIQKTIEAIKDTFEQEDGSFRLTDKTEKSGCLVSALAILAGATTNKKNTAEAIVGCMKQNHLGMVKATLSSKGFIYDALLSTDFGYENFVIDDIKSTYKPMLEAGATSFWETEIGADDFGGIGSLCHGWSAMPVYYFAKLNAKKQ